MSELSEHWEPMWHDNPTNPWQVIESLESLGYSVTAVIHVADPKALVLNDRS